MTDFTPGKQQVVDACIRLADRGFLAGTGGNVALRLDEGHFAVTPSATDYYTMRAADIAVLRFAGMEQIEGDKPASVERGLHACLMRAKPLCLATVHTHQPTASAAALLHTAIPVTELADRAALGAVIAIIPYRPSGTGLLVKALARRVRSDGQAYLLASHGVICAAPTMPDAIEAVGRVEAVAARFLTAQILRHSPLGGPARALALDALAGASQQE